MILKKNALIFAPLEGITGPAYRNTINNIFKDWDYLFTDFFRVSSASDDSLKSIEKHIGEKNLQNSLQIKKTVVQILADKNSKLENFCNHLNTLPINFLDLNAGCPSKKVYSNKGGSYLLDNLDDLKNIVTRLRQNFSKHLSVKIRIGGDNDENFLKIINLLNTIDVDAITIHGRLRTKIYSGENSLFHIKEAVYLSKTTIIGNGGIWNLTDINKMFKETNCQGVMPARGALKAPWLAKEFILQQELSLKEKLEYIFSYYQFFHDELIKQNLDNEKIIALLKSISKDILQDFHNGEEITTKLLRSNTVLDFFNNLKLIQIN